MAKLDKHNAAASTFGFHGPACGMVVKGKVVAPWHCPSVHSLLALLFAWGPFAFC